jgi:HPt (histidine-containing phosphotransfer) domain-containing protein
LTALWLEVPVIDHTMLDRFRGLRGKGKPGALKRIITVYLESTEANLETLRCAVRAMDAEAVERAAHTMKSSSAHVGARRLSELCRELEGLGREDSLQTATDLLAEIQAEYEQVCPELKAQLTTG